MRRLVLCVCLSVVAMPVAWSGSAAAEPTPISLDCLPPSQTPWFDEGPTDPNQTMGSLGERRGVVVFVDFSDAPQSETTTSYFNRFAPDTTATFGELSYGRLDLTLTPVHKWYRMSKASTDYGFDRFSFTFQKHREFIAEVVSLADPDVDFSNYDFVLVAASKRAAVDGTAFVAANPGDGIPADGTTVRFAAAVEERTRDLVIVPGFGSPVLIHEATHLFGIPDLYNNVAPHYDDAGTWDYMAQPEPVVPGLFGWHKWKLGWLTDDQVLCQAGPGQITATLSPMSVAGGTKLIAVRTGPNEAYAVEVRQPVGTDARLCEKGVLVYSVSTERMTGSDPSAIQVKTAQADNPNQRGTCGFLYNAPFDVEAGEISTFQDPEKGIKVEVLAASGTSFEVRVTKTGSYVPSKQPHGRTISLTLKKHLVASGLVSAPDGFTPCTGEVAVQIERKAGFSWKPVTTSATGADGRFRVKLPDKPGTYRAKALPIESAVNTCSMATSSGKKHSH